MTRKNQRLAAIFLILAGVAVAAGLSLYALRGNVTFFMTPTDLAAAEAGKTVRLGGMVVYGTIERDGLTTRFTVTDYANDLPVEYTGIVPDLFVEGSGVVADGRMQANGTFVADKLLAKHDENYVPRELEEMTAAQKKLVVEETTSQ